MLATFAEPPNWADYEPDPADEVAADEIYTEAIMAYFNIQAPLGGRSFFLVNKDGEEIPTPVVEWVNG